MGNTIGLNRKIKLTDLITKLSQLKVIMTYVSVLKLLHNCIS